MSEQENKTAWDKEHIEAWVERFGTPEEYSQKIVKNPTKVLGSLMDVMGDVDQKRILNLMGSNGNKAVALARLGATVTVVDFSESNRTYALQLAKEADVKIEYVLSDVLAFQTECTYDITFAEMGILHYFIDLKPFFMCLNRVTSKGGLIVIRDFHPISTKLISSRGSTAKVRKHKIDGDYFDTSLTEKVVSYGKYSKDEAPERVYLRNWTLGEIVTEAAACGLTITALIEEPNLSSDVFDKGIPKTFILKMTK